MKLELSFGKGRPPNPPDHETPFHILVLGDMDGRTSRNVAQPLVDRRPVAVDVDTLEAFLKRLHAEVRLSQADTAPALPHLQLSGIDDLHPDQLFKRIDLFAELRQTRQRLLDPATFASTADKVRSWAGAGSENTSGKYVETAPAPPSESDAQTIERLLGRAPSRATATSSAAGELIRKIVARYVVPAPASDQAALVAVVDAAVAESMRRLLHDPAFQALEATWRGVDFLLRQVETDETLKVHLMNVSQAELAAEVMASDDLRSSALFRILVESTVESPGAEPWALLLGLFSFELVQEDIELLGRLAKLAQAAGAPFVAAAGADFLRAILENLEPASDTGTAWETLRSQPEAAWLGLACPRFLLRYPYGHATDAVSAFDFEECAARPEAGEHLWGHPALALGVLLGQMFAQSGWGMNPAAELELSGLPVHSWKENGESHMTPCGEIWLKDVQAEKLLRQGLMPFQSIQGKDVIRLARAQSIHQPPAPLAGRWA